ncbi:MAG: lysophospholipid acyltransferase family protein [Pirellulales bacterium]
MTRRDESDAAGGGHSAFGKILYAILWVLCRTLGVAVFGFRSRFEEPLPKEGGLIVLSSHQTFLDPLLLGLATDRRLSSLARSSLYRFRPFAAVITALDAVPIDREASAVKAMKLVIQRLERGAAVIIFPEGARTFDGRLGELKSGFALIAKKARVPIVPVAIVGGFECWPRTRLLPRPGRIRLEFGRILTADEVAALGDKEIFDVCSQRLHDLDAKARAALRGSATRNSSVHSG